MIRLGSEMDSEVRENMRGGTGEIRITHCIKKDEFKAKCRLCAKITIQPGDSIGFHEHSDEEEIYIITRGTGLVNDNGNEQKVTPGSAILTGNGAGHSISNIGNEPLELIAVILLY